MKKVRVEHKLEGERAFSGIIVFWEEEQLEQRPPHRSKPGMLGDIA